MPSSHSYSPVHRRSGQISILMILSLVPLFTLFAFVVNVGMLVNAKISLQNAADLAAYAGAATQARQLTHISHLNYQMRQVYKKFLYKYYVIGNMSLKCFPRADGTMASECNNVNTGQDMKWVNVDRSGTPSQRGFPGMPIVCISLSAESNVCQLATAVPIVQRPSCIPFSPACGQLTQYIDAAAAIQKASCKASTMINLELLLQWLYATEFSPSTASNQNVQGLVDDIGLVPEEIILRSRIKTVESYINQPARSVTQRTLNALGRDTDQARVERSILAFKTAFGNLNSQVFDDSSITLSELLPAQPLLTLTDIKTDFEAGAAHMDDRPNSNGENDKCDMSLELIKANPYVGVYKEPTSVVHYAVKLTAKARLLFNPFPFGRPDDGIDLTAYAAAAPFGSRIGPRLDENHFRKSDKLQLNGGSRDVFYPSLVVDNDGARWDRRRLLEDYRRIMAESAHQGIASGAVGRAELQKGIHAALIPDEFEIGKYNIPVDVETAHERKGMVRYYQLAADSGRDAHYTFWAPVAPPDRRTEVTEDIKKELEKVSDNFGAAGIQGGILQARSDMKQVLEQSVGQILRTLETRNSYNVVQIQDPFSTVFYRQAGSGVYPPVFGKLPSHQKNAAASSYSTDHDHHYYALGRDGYSVKFIPFRMLVSNSTGWVSNDQGLQRWPQVKDPFVEKSDLLLLQH